jgi:hypothetical protein
VKWKLVQKWGFKTIFEGWDRPEYEPGMIKKIAAVWAFRRGSKRRVLFPQRLSPAFFNLQINLA